MSSKKYPLISVVMLNYNGLKYLKKTIKPILNQDYSNFEFIIVDNGSTDGSLEYIEKFKKIRLIKSPKLREKNFACNYAIKRVNGDYIFLMDNDALIKDYRLLKNLSSIYNKQIGVIGLSFIEKSFKKSKSYGSYFGYYFIKENKNIDSKKLKKYNLYKIGFPEGKALFISRYKWEKIGGYDDYLKFGGDDNDLGIKLWLMGYKNILYSKTLQVHLGLPERQDNKKYSLKWKEMFYAHLYTIVKNYSSFNMLLTLFLYSIFGFLKSIKQSILRFKLGPFLAFFRGYFLFLKNLPHALEQRKIIQSKRIIKTDIFLRISPPKLN